MATHASNPEVTVENIQEDVKYCRYQYFELAFSKVTVQFLLDVIKEKDIEISNLNHLLSQRQGS